MRIDADTTLEEVGFILKSNDLGLNIEFGAGGYEATITDLKAKTSYVEYSNDLLDAICGAINKAAANKKIDTAWRDDVTIPATPKTKLSIRELSKLFSSGKETKLKL